MAQPFPRHEHLVGGFEPLRMECEAPDLVVEGEVPREHRDGEGGQGTEEDEHGAVPPGHRDGLFVLLLDEVVGVIGLEDLMMHHGVGLEGIAEAADRAMHHKLVDRPFKEGGKNHIRADSGGAPKQKFVHGVGFEAVTAGWLGTGQGRRCWDRSI